MIERRGLLRFAVLSVLAAVTTIGLKTAAYVITGSIGLLSDALESLANLVAALVALYALWVAARPADEEHTYGHTKAEYFSSGFEGLLIVAASVGIVIAAVRRFIEPQPIQEPALGLAVNALASVVNFGVARVLRRPTWFLYSLLVYDVWHKLFVERCGGKFPNLPAESASWETCRHGGGRP